MRTTTLLTLALLSAACSGERHFFVKTDDGAHLKVRLRGNLDSDAVVLLLHGGPGGDVFAYTLGEAQEQLEEDHAWAYLDQRGMGASEGLGGPVSDYTLDRAGLDVEDVVDVLASRYPDKRLFLYGHSWGGTLGTKALLDTDVRDHLDGWIEAAGCHDTLREPRHVEARMRAVAAEEIEAGRNVEAWNEIVEWLDGFDSEADTFADEDLNMLNYLGYKSEALSADNLSFEDLGWATSWERYTSGVRPGMASGVVLDQIYVDWYQWTSHERLGEIDLPAAYLYANYDFVCPVGHGTEAAELNPNGTLTVFESSAHSIMIHETQKYVDTIAGFIEATR